jgi:perosamine synthetase
MNIIPHNKPTLSIEDEKAVIEVLRSGYIAQGEKVEQFENEFAAFVGLRYGVAVSNGTAALFLALRNYICDKNNEVIIPTYVCTALLNAIDMAGGIPKIVDVDPADFNISETKIKESISDSTKAIVIPHIHGVPARINRSQYHHDIGIIEDCATAVGCRYDRKPVGNIGDIAIFSFYATKFMTTGQGGMILTDDEKIAVKLKDYRNFDNPISYYPRFNFQMTDIQAGLGLSQLKQVKQFLKRRAEISNEYENLCIKKGWRWQQPVNKTMETNHYRFIIRVEEPIVNLLQQYLLEHGIKTIIPIENRELLHNYLSLDRSLYKESEVITKTTLSLPIYPSLLDKELSKIISTLNNY